MQLLPNLQVLAGRYKGVLLDQFGVLHDGRKPYRGSVAALRWLRDAQLNVYLLSNSSQRAHTAYGRLESMGFRREWITEIFTSGEMTYQNLLHRKGPLWQSLGRRCLHFTWNSRGKIQLQDLDLQVVTDVKEAEFILSHGTDALGVGWEADPIPHSFEQLAEKLKEAITLSSPPPMIIANPDFVTVDGVELRKMPGSFGRMYEAMGGRVIWMGKPGRVIYEHILHVTQCQPSELVAIGDSLEHDIKGASKIGIDSVFVCGGIHAGELFHNGSVSLTSLQSLCERQSVEPTYYMDHFDNEKV